MITKIKAETIAQIEALRLAEMPDRKHRQYNQAEFLRETDNEYVFFAACPELLKLDFAPGGIMVYVSKTNGTVIRKIERHRNSREMQTA